MSAAVNRRLTDLAHEINVRLQKVDDHRLSASLKLAEAKVACKEAKVSFKKWVEAEIKNIGYAEITRLAKIGGSPDPAKALEDLRSKIRRAVRNNSNKKSDLAKSLSSESDPRGSLFLAPDPDVFSGTPIDRCAMTVRRVVRQALQYLPKSEWPELFADIHASLDDLEAKSQDWEFPDGYHPPRQSA